MVVQVKKVKNAEMQGRRYISCPRLDMALTCTYIYILYPMVQPFWELTMSFIVILQVQYEV